MLYWALMFLVIALVAAVFGFGADLPAVKGPAPGGDAAGMAPPLGRSVDQRNIAADVLAFEQGRPHMTGLVGVGVVVGRRQWAAADAHAL